MITSILIPAHQEETTIGRCLSSLLMQAEPAEFHVIVAANGCTDNTADVARTFPGVEVIELAEGSKIGAVNAARERASQGPHIYLDGDLAITTAAARALFAAVSEGKALAAIGRMDVDLSHASFAVRQFYKAWRFSPYFDHGKFGGVYALSVEGQARIGHLPRLTNDDEFVSRQFTREETARFVKCEDFLWAVRCQLHFMGGRDDRIHFERQAELAERLGYKAHGGLKFVERFMKHYFLIAKEVGDLTRIFCAVLESQEVKTAPGMTGFLSRFPRKRSTIPESGRFKLDAGRMNVTDDEVFTNDPVNILRLFSFADLHGVSVHPDALKRVRRSLVHVTKLRHEPEANHLFVNLLTGSRDPEKTLRRLNEAGVLARFIPDFGKIVAMMQFNMYHHYTVDEHLIRSVGILSQIERGRLKEDHPVASDIIHSLVSRRVLYVAVLLHDIAKGRDEDHSIAGERIALELCPRLGLTPAETDTVAWLVRHHLLMSETAQMRDLNDFKTILDFIKVVQSPERLKLLLILTVVDIRAVGPGVWNGWKGQLLRTLYAEAEPLLSGGHSSVTRKARVAAAQKAFMQAKPGWTQDQHQAWTQRHYDPYWMTVDLTHQLAHAKLVEQATARGEAIATDIRTDEFTAITELTVYAPDHPRLLALITGACAAAGANIAGAQIFTTADGMALDTILIQREFSQAEDERRRAERVTELIRKALRGELHIRQAISDVRPLTSRIKAFTVEPQVIIDNEGSNRTTVIEVAGLDRIGLLYDLTEALFRLSLNIASAHVTTFGERAVDVFYVTDLTGAKIERDTRRKTIEQELLGVLKPGKD